MKPTPIKSAKIRTLLPIATVAILIVTIVTVAGVLFFFRGRAIMEQQLKDKLQSTAAAAAMQFAGETIERIKDTDTVESSPALRDTVEKLDQMRDSITHLRFAYIMKKTENPDELAFVADADLALTDEELDTNENGIVDEDEMASQPGERYDWTEFPALGEAFLHPSVDDHVGSDQWGPVISGYAPIRTKDGRIVAVLGIDMSANDFVALSSSIFSPIALLLILLASMTLAAGTTLYFWRRRLETLHRLDIERSGLLRLAFHQLGGPLTIISWSLEELEEEGPASIQRIVANIQEGVKRLTEILQTLKNADMVHNRKIEYKPTFGSLSEILENVVKESGTQLAVRKQHVALELEKDITMKLDSKLIAGVMHELLTNAISFSPEDTTITVRSRRNGKFAEILVSDEGYGVPKQDLRRLFSEFTRGSNATKYKADGNGLGLYIVRGIVEQAGGKVSLESTEGKGTTVTVKLPMA